VKIFELVIKTVNVNKRKWLVRLNQNGVEVGETIIVCVSVATPAKIIVVKPDKIIVA